MRTSLWRVLRLMRQHQLLAPQRQPQPAEPKRHEGTILAGRPDPIWSFDGTAGFPLRDGQVPIFAMIDHGSACCLGIHVARRGTRSEARELVRQAVREQFGGFSEGIARGMKLRHDHGSQRMSDGLPRELCLPGPVSSPASLSEPEANGRNERFLGALQVHLFRATRFVTRNEPAEALEEFRQCFCKPWLVKRLGFQSQRQAHRPLLALEPAA